MKVMIMTDLEGPSGINGRADACVGNQTVNTPIACQVLMDEVNACVRGLLAAGADDILVWDGHGGSNSMDIRQLEAPARFGNIGGGLAPATYVDASFDACILLGYHGMAGVPDAYMSHSYNSHGIRNMRLNGENIGEIGMEALHAAYFGVPTILVTGDQAACRESRKFLGDVATVETKRALSRYTVLNRNPRVVQKEIEAAAERALQLLPHWPVKTIPAELELQVEFMCPNAVVSHVKAGRKLVETATVSIQSDDFMDLFAQFLGWAPGVHNRYFGITPTWRLDG